MLDEILAYLKNYFVIDKLFGDFVIENGCIRYANGEEVSLKNGQYFRVIGGMNSGIYQHFDDTPIDFVTDEAFNGAIWRLAIPQDLISIADEMAAWREKYERIGEPAMSPYQSESYNGYSYTKQTPSNGSVGMLFTIYGKTLARYRKI